uniref:integrase core domain-containing protein n=1 Tax=Desulfovibrio sp. Fe33 TaxID=3020842 RepID=UPI00234DB339
GIDVEFIEPGKPQQNGSHERMHRTLKREFRKGRDMRQQTRLMRSWRRIYNHRRGHEALGMAVPASRYVRSVRSFPPIIPDFQYDEGEAVRRVKRSGEILWAGKMRYINQGLRGCSVGLLDDQNGDLIVYAGSVLLGLLKRDGSGGLIRPPEPKQKR